MEIQESRISAELLISNLEGIHIHQNAMEIPNQRIKDSGIVFNEILKGNHINQMPFKNMKSGNPGIEDFCSIPNYNFKWMSYKPNAFPNFRNPGFKDSGIVSNEIFQRNSYKPTLTYNWKSGNPGTQDFCNISN